MNIEEVRTFRVEFTVKHVETLMFLMQSADLIDEAFDGNRSELKDFQKLVEKVFTNTRMV